jgi:hypothetical protein
MLEGMVTSAGDSLRMILAPPLSAGEVRATLHVDDDCGLRLAAAHENPFKPGPIDTVPPVDVVDKDAALRAAALPAVSCSTALV